jgi:hypothetical protein
LEELPMSVFSRLDRMTSRAVDRTFSVRFQVQPGKKTPNGRPGPDLDRDQWEGRGVLDETPSLPPIEIGKRDGDGNDFRSVLVGNVIELSIDKTRYPQASQARQGDRLQTDDLRRFEVSSVRPDGLSRVVLQLAAI